MTLRPVWGTRWVNTIFFIALAGLVLALWVRDWVTRGYDLSDPFVWLPPGIAVIFAALGVAFWRMYIKVDETTIVVGFVIARRLNRREVASIRVGGYAPRFGRRVYFLRADGSRVFTTALQFWGNDQMARLAAYLQVPVDLGATGNQV